MNRHIIACLTIASSMLISPAIVHGSELIDLAKQYVELMQYSQQYTQNHAQCLAAEKAIPPQSLLATSPNRFYGITPNSSLWPKVVDAYNEYYEEICLHPTKEEFLGTLAQTYASELTASDLTEAIRFYSSPVGRRLISAHRSAGKRVSRMWGQWSAKQVPLADENFGRRLREIAKRTVAK